jgi:thiamine biosynthesis lipoprotein
MRLHPTIATSIPSTGQTTAMGTVVRQAVYGINGAAVAAKVFEELRRFDGLWSPLRPGNMADAIRRNAGIAPVKVDSDTFRILSASREIGIRSGGAFDITIDPLIRLWREAARQKALPPAGAIETSAALVSIDELELGPGSRVFLPRRGQGIDLGAIGKGYAADRIRELYKESGIRHAVIDIGGNVLVLGARPGGSSWKIGIKNPLHPDGEFVGYIEAENCSVVTSGDYERFYDYADGKGASRRFHHIIDPRSGWSAETDVAGVTVMAASSCVADALATAAFILGMGKGMKLCNSFEDAHSLFIDNRGEIRLSTGMRDRFTGITAA